MRYENQLGVSIVAGDVGTPTGVPGDYNGNNIVDAADYTVWRDGGPLLNEGASLGMIDAADYNFWKTHFGMGIGKWRRGWSWPCRNLVRCHGRNRRCVRDRCVRRTQVIRRRQVVMAGLVTWRC